jgi:hypothetical protein
MRNTLTVLLPLTLLPLAVASPSPASAAELVQLPAFESVQLRGGGSVVVRRGPAQRVTILNGSSAYTQMSVNHRGQLTIDACNHHCPRQYNLQIEIQSPDAPDAAISGGGSISFAPGFAPQGDFSVAVNGGGQIDARALSAAKVSAAINGGGRILSGDSEHLSAAVSGGGEVRYTGSPHVSSVVNGGGAVRRGN